MRRTKYLLFHTGVEGDGPIHALFLGPDSERAKDAYLSSGDDRRWLVKTWAHGSRTLTQHRDRPLEVQERMLRNFFRLPRGALQAVGYFCDVCSMFHPTDPKKIKTCKKCNTEMCPAAGCRCKEGQ